MVMNINSGHVLGTPTPNQTGQSGYLKLKEGDRGSAGSARQMFQTKSRGAGMAARDNGGAAPLHVRDARSIAIANARLLNANEISP